MVLNVLYLIMSLNGLMLVLTLLPNVNGKGKFKHFFKFCTFKSFTLLYIGLYYVRLLHVQLQTEYDEINN